MGMVDAFAFEKVDFSGITDEKGVGILVAGPRRC